MNDKVLITGEESKNVYKVIERIIISQKITEEISQNDDYISWLEEFTTKHPKFCDDNYLLNKISDTDKINISKISNFFESIELYAKKNYIHPTKIEYGVEFYVKHNNVGYKIGVMVGQGTVFFVERTKLTKNNINDFINFELIQESKAENNTKIIQEKLDLLNACINSIASDVPLEEIKDNTEKRLKFLLKNKSNKN